MTISVRTLNIRDAWDRVRAPLDEWVRDVSNGLRNAERRLSALEEVVWDDLRFPASAVNPPGSTADPDLDTSTGLYRFDAAGTELVCFQVQMPHAWKEGTSIIPHVHWLQTHSGNAYWRLEYRIVAPNGAWPSAWTVLNAWTPVFTYQDGTLHQITSLGSIDMTGRPISTMLVCKLSRVGSVAEDTHVGDVSLLEVDFHYQLDSRGSSAEFRK